MATGRCLSSRRGHPTGSRLCLRMIGRAGSESGFALILALTAFYVVLGCFLDASTIILVIVPLFLTLLAGLFG